MQGNYADFAQSVVAIVDFFARQALAGSCSIKRIIKTEAARAIPIVAKTRGPVAADPCGSAHTVVAPPKLRHGVTSLQGLELSVTHSSCPRRFAAHPIMGIGFKCDALICH